MDGAGVGDRSRDVRPAIAAALLLALATVVGVVLVGGGSSGLKASAAPAGCVSLWNKDTKALVYGYHSFHGHNYRQAEVLYLDRDGSVADRGDCAVVFPSASLDPEPFVAAKVYRGGRWLSLSEVSQVSAVRVAELQVEAVKGANATLRPDGALDASL